MKPLLPGREVGLPRFERVTPGDLRVPHVDGDLVAGVHQQGVRVRRESSQVDFCGLGGPVGTPLVWTKAKLTGSTQLLLQLPLPLPWHSRLSMLSAEHQWVSSQLVASANGAKPGG